MPTYNYRCTNPDCLKEHEFFHSIQERGTPSCPNCGYPMNKLVGAPPFRFKNPRGTMGVISNKGSRGIDREDISF